MREPLPVGIRVKVDLVDIPKDQRQCEWGVVTKTVLRFPKTPELTEVRYTVHFDKPYIRPECVIYKNIRSIQCGEQAIVEVDWQQGTDWMDLASDWPTGDSVDCGAARREAA